ncbi:MAG: carboxymuconolactone decarboxylase family protein [Eubacterium sp.]|nr:carboxymuconolactone decarboxylase family protein [Eubacterium sp.]
MIDSRAILDEFMSGVGKLAETNGSVIGKFVDLDGAAGVEGEVLDAKTKELICVGIGINKICKYCITVHVNNAYAAGATREEILAAAEIALTFGGGPALAYSASYLNAALDTFEHDYD